MQRLVYPLLLLPLLSCGVAQSAQKAEPVAQPYVATAIGRLDSAGEARQLVAAADGVIANVLVARGDRVTKGQALLKVDCAQRLASAGASRASAAAMQAAAETLASGARPEEIAVAEAELNQAIAFARNQQQRFSQAEKLIDEGFVSRREMEARTNDRDSSSAAVSAAQARLDQLRRGARNSELVERNSAANAAAGEAEAAAALAAQCVLKSPIDGEVLQILRREGEFSGASQGQALLVVGDMQRLSVRAEINERDAPHIRLGQPVDIWIEGQSKKWRGRVSSMAGFMGRRSARSLDPTDRFDRDIREALIEFTDGAPPLPLVGLRLMVGVRKA
jgi:HlyD family secretion protein